jgi:hypothetical protein
MMNETEAAGYCGLPTKHFKAFCPVQPIELANKHLRYDRRDLDQWIDNEKSGAAETSQSAILGRLP